MECPRRWATIYIFIYFLITDVSILCQNVPSELVPKSVQVNVPNLQQGPSSGKPQIIYTSTTPNNGASQERAAQMMQMASQPEKCGNSLPDNRPTTHNYIPLQVQTPIYYAKEPASSQPAVSTDFYSNIGPSAPNLLGQYAKQVQQPSITENLPYNVYRYTAQNVQSENYVNSQPRSACQNPLLSNEALNYYLANPMKFAGVNTPNNLQISPLPIYPEVNADSEEIENSNQEAIVDDDHGIPLNLQINLPSQPVPAPRITLISAVPPISNTDKEKTPFPPFGFPPPPPPIVMSRSRSNWRSLLPIILIALFNDQGYGGGCCCCNCDSSDPIPIPYPIPIPVNNPIINNRSS